MSSRADHEKQKLIHEKCQIILGNLLREEDNKYCVDCDAKGPRWASWNLGIFLCIRCAGIHRNLGVHISKVKSVNLDTWTPEQVACLQQMGNSQARAVYEANLSESFRRPQTDSSLESFIRAKYEQKKYIAKEWVPPPAPKPAFDIEEEKKKEREKKKKSHKNISQVEIPALTQVPSALPRPHTGSVSPSILSVQQEPTKTQVPAGSADLLNLGDVQESTEDDIFDAFLCAPVQSNTKTSETASNDTSIKSIEADFFNQKSNESVNPSNKMTKESILSLYGTNNCQAPTAQHNLPMYALPGGMYVPPPAYAQVAVAGYAAIPNAGVTTPGTVYNPFSSFGSSAVLPDTRPNTWAHSVSSGGEEAPPCIGQQMANLRLSPQTWNMDGTASVMVTQADGMVNPASGMMWPNSQNISNNLWQ